MQLRRRGVFAVIAGAGILLLLSPNFRLAHVSGTLAPTLDSRGSTGNAFVVDESAAAADLTRTAQLAAVREQMELLLRQSSPARPPPELAPTLLPAVPTVWPVSAVAAENVPKSTILQSTTNATAPAAASAPLSSDGDADARLLARLTVVWEKYRASVTMRLNASAGVEPPAPSTTAKHRSKPARSGIRYCVGWCAANECCAAGWRRQTDYVRVACDTLPVSRTTSADAYGDVTFVTQGTVDRLRMLPFISERWAGPKIFVFSLLPTDDLAAFLQSSAGLCAQWHNMKVDSVEGDIYAAKVSRDHPPLVPINALRNMAVDMAPTNFIFTADIDFVPSDTLYTTLTGGTMPLLPLLAVMDQPVLVVPHWELLRCAAVNISVPRNYGDLRQQVERGLVRPFHTSPGVLLSNVAISPITGCSPVTKNSWSSGIRTTNYDAWLSQSKTTAGFFPLSVDGDPRGDDKFWEPFTVVQRVDAQGHWLPRYDERFVGRHRNKIDFVSALRARSYHFFTVRKEFLVHVPHATGNQTDDGDVIFREMMFLYQRRREFLGALFVETHKAAAAARRTSRFDNGFKV